MTKNIITAFLLLIITFPVMAANQGVGGGDIIAPPNPDLGDQEIQQQCTRTNCGSGYYCDYSSKPVVGECEQCGQSGAFDYVTQCQFNPPSATYENGITLTYTSTSTEKSSCTWNATCPAGSYLYKTISYTGQNGCGNGSQACYRPITSCKKCSELGAPYYDNPERINTYSAPHENTNGKSCPQHLSSDNNPTTNDLLNNYATPLLHDAGICINKLGIAYECPGSDYDIDDECSQCTGNTIVNSNGDGCISCADIAAGTNPNNDHSKCICQEDYYYVTTNSTITTTENNNNACKEIPNILYKWTNFDTGANETTTDGKVPLTGNYTTLSSNDQTYQQITNTSIFPIHGWTYDTYDNKCNKSTSITVLFAGNSIRRTLLDSALKCIFKRTGNEDFAIQPAFASKTIEYQRKPENGPITLCRATTAPTQKCKPDAANLCTAAALTKCTEFNNFTSYYAPEEKWNLTDDQGNKIKDANGKTISYKAGDTVKYVPQNSTTPVYLTLEVKQCEAGYYCTNGTRTKCPVGMTSDAGSDDITDCKTGTETKVCDDTGNCIPLPSGLTLRQKQ